MVLTSNIKHISNISLALHINICPALATLRKCISHFPWLVELQSPNRANIKNFFAKSDHNKENVKYVRCLDFSNPPPDSPRTFNTCNIFNIVPVLATFQKKYLRFPLVRRPRLTEQGKCFFLKTVAKTREMLNMLHVWPFAPLISPKHLAH